ncbi:MAG: AAA family ATPase [Pirellulaceae bacterium]|nr:AAA family ATPase [Pirellulaceae bacterium]
MEAVIFIGIQASGKSTFYQQRFFTTHVRINLDQLKTRNREKRFFDVCLQTRQRFVIDNTNPTKEDRQRYIATAKAAGFRVIGYFFHSEIEECQRRNESRSKAQHVPLGAITATHGRLETPTFGEGFDELHRVRIGANNRFLVRRKISKA